MKKIKVISVGNLKEKYWQQAELEYLKRLTKFCKLEIVEVKESKIKDSKQENKILNEEATNITKHLNNDDYLICLAIEGEQVTSEKIAETIRKLELIHSGRIVFIIGGSNGVSDQIKRQAHLLSFGKITLPHQLAKIVLLEQIYRAYKINNNQTYHK